MKRWGKLILCVGAVMLAAGCPKGGQQFKAGRQAEDIQDYDTALQYYQKALASEPNNAQFRIKLNQIRFEAGEFHVKKGLALRDKGDLQGAAAEFQRAYTIDPSSPVAVQELRRTLDEINELAHKQDEQASGGEDTAGNELAAAPPELKPLSNAPIDLKMINDVKIIFDTIGKLAGVTVTYDPDFPARRINVDLNKLTLQQALDIVCMQSKTFWKPVTENIIFIAQDTTQKHKDYDEQLVETFYLSNTVQSQDLTEIANGLRQVLNLTKVQQLNSQNAIIVRDTPDKLAIARKLLKDIDKAKPEVVIQVEVLSANTDRLRDLGVLPGQSASIAFTPPGSTSSSSSSNTPTGIPLNAGISSADYTVTLPGATANFVLTDTTTKIIQNPEIRSVDGQTAKLNVGSRVPIATGSFQAGVGVGTTSVNPLVNTQFTYLDVGVNVSITPRVHPNHEVSMKVTIDVSQVTGTATIGGIQQPIIGQRKIEHDIRLREGEVNILGGLFERTDTKTVNGWPGLAQIPFMKYLFSDNKTEHVENDVLIVLVPRIVRLPDWTRANLKPISSGVEQNITTRRASDIRVPAMTPPPATAPQQPVPQQVPGQQPPAAAVPGVGQPAPANPSEANPQAPRLRFDPQTLNLAPGQTATLGVSVDNVNDLYSIPMILQYDPAVISVEEVQHGGFLASGNQEIAIVQRVDKERGQAMIAATRQPNTPGVSGSGTLLGVVVKALAPGTTNISIVQVNAKDSQQKPLALLTGEAAIQVK
jgi:general secretion pathway protein D